MQLRVGLDHLQNALVHWRPPIDVQASKPTLHVIPRSGVSLSASGKPRCFPAERLMQDGRKHTHRADEGNPGYSAPQRSRPMLRENLEKAL